MAKAADHEAQISIEDGTRGGVFQGAILAGLLDDRQRGFFEQQERLGHFGDVKPHLQAGERDLPEVGFCRLVGPGGQSFDGGGYPVRYPGQHFILSIGRVAAVRQSANLLRPGGRDLVLAIAHQVGKQWCFGRLSLHLIPHTGNLWVHSTTPRSGCQRGMYPGCCRVGEGGGLGSGAAKCMVGANGQGFVVLH